MKRPTSKCPHCGRWVETYATTIEGVVHLFGHRIGVPGTGSERGPWCPASGAKAGRETERS